MLLHQNKKMKINYCTKIIGITFITILSLELILLISGFRVLLNEKKVLSGERYETEDYGNLGDNKSASLVCKYFDGRKTRITIFWYSANNIMGRDSCPFLFNSNQT